MRSGRSSPLRVRIALPLLLGCNLSPGLRSSELRGLRWSDADLKQNLLHVRQRADRYGKIGKPKSKAGQATVPIESARSSTHCENGSYSARGASTGWCSQRRAVTASALHNNVMRHLQRPCAPPG